MAALVSKRIISMHNFEKSDVHQRSPVTWRQWGMQIDPAAIRQMQNACSLPVACSGALMPDAHVGYGLPIGGVLAVDGAVIPYAVGVDIACRMKLSVLDLPVTAIEHSQDRLIKAIETETRFGVGVEFKVPRKHSVMDEDWSVTPLTASLKDKAWRQMGTSGSGNHFVEFGVFTLYQDEGGLAAGRYLALLSHSGSRGAGAAICSHYSKLARCLHPDLPHDLQHLAWLPLSSEEGKEYWDAMELMGHYASANHLLIHQHIMKNLGVEMIFGIENHHNFAWKEIHGEREVIVHRKGATPAGKGVLGVIPGSMTAPGFVVRGKGVPESLHSSAHGAGRAMSRTAANKQFNWSDVKKVLKEHGVKLLSAGIDEAPMAYKDIHSVMAAQEDLVEILGRFDPKLVKMAPAGEPPED